MLHQQWINIKNEYKTQLAGWSEATGLTLTSNDHLNCLADNLLFRQAHHLPLPKGISQQDAREIISISDSITLYEFNHYTFTMGSEFLRTVDGYINDAVNRNSKMKYVLFVGHDATLMSVMHALNITITHIPDYASRFNVSVYQQKSGFIIKYSFNNKTILTKSFTPPF